jgi:hypothetical protein
MALRPVEQVLFETLEDINQEISTDSGFGFSGAVFANAELRELAQEISGSKQIAPALTRLNVVSSVATLVFISICLAGLGLVANMVVLLVLPAIVLLSLALVGLTANLPLSDLWYFFLFGRGKRT